MTAAQKAAKANFKKAIEYRKKTGVSLKEAFAHVYGKKKVGAAPKKKAAKKKAAPKKAAKKVAKKAAPKKAAKKKHTKYGVVKKHVRRVAGVKKKVSEQSILNKIHKVKNEVNSLDELQHKHMVSGFGILNDIKENLKKINVFEKQVENYKKAIKNPKNKIYKAQLQKQLASIKKYISELKTHSRELKKHI